MASGVTVPGTPFRQLSQKGARRCVPVVTASGFGTRVVLGGGSERKWGSGVWSFFGIGFLDCAFARTDGGLGADFMLFIAPAGFASRAVNNRRGVFHGGRGTILVVVIALDKSGLGIFSRRVLGRWICC